MTCTYLSLYVSENVQFALGKYKSTNKGFVRDLLKHAIIFEGSIGNPPNNYFQPRDMCCEQSGQILVTDHQNHALHLLDTNGKLKKFLMMEQD